MMSPLVCTAMERPPVNFDYIEWDDDDDPRGNVLHIEAAGLTPQEVEEVLAHGARLVRMADPT